MGKIYLIRRLLPSMGDAITLEPLISLAHEQIYKTGNGGELWLQCDERIADFFREHPFIHHILSPLQQPPAGTNIVLDVSQANDCPSLRSLMHGGKENAARLFCDAATVDGRTITYDERGPKLYFSEDEKRQIQFIRRGMKPKKLVAVQVKAGHWWKAYEHVEQLVKLLVGMDDIQVFLTNDDEMPFKANGMIPLVQLPYRDLMVWLGAMDLFIGLDSGPTHLAAAIGTRVYGIFGSTDPEIIIGMYGAHVSWNKFAASKCPRKRCWLRPCEKVICLKVLSPWAVQKDITRVLKEEYQNPRLRLQETPIIRPNLTSVLPSASNGFQLGTMTIPSANVTTEGSKLSEETTPLPPQPPAPFGKGDRRGTAIMRLDGLGGSITLTDHAKKLYEQTGRKVTLVTRGYEELFKDNPYIEEVVNVGMRDWKECSFVMRNQFESLAEIRFGLGKWYSQNGSFRQDFTEYEELFNQFPLDFNQLDKHGLHHIQLTDRTLGLPYNDIETELYSDEKFDIDGDFVLINNGVDVIHGSMRQTKCWEGWDELVSLIPSQVVQVGTASDPPVDGVVDLRGRTELLQLIYLIKKAKTIVVTEGGIMHLAYAARNPNVVVLGGPTQGPLFRYPGHKWITSYVCGNCWSSTHGWYQQCPKDCDSVCMKTILPFRVAEAVSIVD